MTRQTHTLQQVPLEVGLDIKTQLLMV